MKKTIYIIAALIIIAGGFYFYDQSHKQVKAPETKNEAIPSPALTQTPTPTAKPSPTPTPKTNAQGGTFSSGEDTGDGSSVQVYEVAYDGKNFSPASIDINKNDWIFFKNASDVDIWVASNPHPTHTDYPGFDSKQKIAPGKTYKFQFTKSGTWGYHNHLNPAQGGKVVVK